MTNDLIRYHKCFFLKASLWGLRKNKTFFGGHTIFLKPKSANHNHRLSRWFAQAYNAILPAELKDPALAKLPHCRKSGKCYSKPSPAGEGVEAVYNLSFIAYIVAETDEVF